MSAPQTARCRDCGATVQLPAHACQPAPSGGSCSICLRECHHGSEALYHECSHA